MARFRSRRVPLALAAFAAVVIGIGAVLALAGNEDSGQPSAETGDRTPAASETPSTAPIAVPTAPGATAPASPPTTTPTAQADVWTIEMLRTGGFAGLAQQLRIDSSGQARFEDQRAQRVTTRVLSGAEVNALAASIASSGFFGQPATQVTTCADCFQLRLTLTMNGRVHTITATDPGMSASLKPLADLLTTLLQRGLES